MVNVVDPTGHQLVLNSACNPVTSWNAGPPRPGGWGALRCSAVDAGASCLIDNRLKIGRGITLAIWVRSIGTTTDNAGVFGVYHNDAAATPYLSYCLYMPMYDSFPSLRYGGNAAGGFEAGAVTSDGIRYTELAEWTRLVVTTTPTDTAYYVNGKLYESISYSRTEDPTYGSTAAVAIGEYWTGLSRNPAMDFDDASIWNRAISPFEVAEDYNLSRNGYRGVLRRQLATVKLIPAAAGNPWYYYTQQNSLIGGVR